MSIEIRTEALKIAAGIHTDIDKVIEAADRFATFLKGEATSAAPKSGRKASPTPAEQVTQPVATPSTDAPPSSAAASAPAASAAPTVTADHITKVIIALVAKSKAKAIEVLGTHGVKKGGDLKPEQYVAAHADLTKALEELKQ